MTFGYADSGAVDFSARTACSTDVVGRTRSSTLPAQRESSAI